MRGMMTGVANKFKPGPTTEFEANTADLTAAMRYQTDPVYTSEPTDFGFSFWIKTTSVAVGNVFRLASSGGSPYNSIMFKNSDGTLFWQDSTVLSSVTSINDGNWHNVVVTSGTTFDMYIDGVLDVSQVTSSNEDLQGDLWIGSDHTGSGGFVMGCHSFYFTDSYWNQARVTANYNAGKGFCYGSINQTGAKAFYPLYNYSGFTGQEIVDQTGNVADLTPTASPVYTGTGAIIKCD